MIKGLCIHFHECEHNSELGLCTHCGGEECGYWRYFEHKNNNVIIIN